MPVSDSSVTLIEGSLVIAFDGQRHRRIDKGVVAFAGDQVVHVGKSYRRPVAERLSAEGKIVMSGLISAHSHVSMQAGSRLILDHGRPSFSRALFLNYLPATAGSPGYLDRPDNRISAEFGFAALLQEWQSFGAGHWSRDPTDEIFPLPLASWNGETEPTDMMA
jgi:cytosine/adenosine deaminase-related metal-dependent hydrolase